jgi:ABC-type lipoprotein export system ATPase subunit
MPAHGEPFIVCDNLVKIYKVADLEAVALQGLDLQVARGELMAIIGNSGSGKTTLLNILGGLDRPSAGRVTVGGRDLLKMSEADMVRYKREVAGFVWQQSSRNLIPYLSAFENVQVPQIIGGVPPRRREAWARELLEAVGLGHRMTHRLSEMSGGEQQRVAIAIGLAMNPPLLLADEPTGEVDTQTAATIYAIFRKVNKEYGTTVVIVSHDPNIAFRVDRVVAIRDGKTSTETVRRVDAELGDVHEEYQVLDSAGRLQLPREYLEQLGIRDRVQVELESQQIVIRPIVRDQAGEPAGSAAQAQADAAASGDAPAAPGTPRAERGGSKGWRRFLRR